MKKYAAYLLSALTAVSLTACGGQQSTTTAASSPAVQTEQAESEASVQETGSAQESQSMAGDSSAQADASDAQSGGNILIAYFSVPETDGVDTVAGASRVAVDGTVMGNNEYIANLIQQETGGDLFAIETVQEYPGTHDALLEFAYNEMMDDARPELASQIEDLDSYDTIFLESYDLGGKTIAPFCTSASDPIDNSLHVFTELAPDAEIAEGLTANSDEDIIPWLNSLGY